MRLAELNRAAAGRSQAGMVRRCERRLNHALRILRDVSPDTETQTHMGIQNLNILTFLSDSHLRRFPFCINCGLDWLGMQLDDQYGT